MKQAIREVRRLWHPRPHDARLLRAAAADRCADGRHDRERPFLLRRFWFRRAAFALTTCLTLECGPTGGSERQRALPEAGRTSFWLPDFRNLAPTDEWIDLLATHHAEVILEVEDAADPLGQVADLARKLSARDVRLEIWPALSAADGDWINARNVDRFVAYAHEIIEFVEAENLPIDSLTIDMEPLPEKSRRLLENPLAGAIAVLTEYDPALYRHAQQGFSALVDELHARGYEVHVSIPTGLESDLTDGDQDIHRLFDLIVGGVAWDDVSYQIYREPLGLGSDYVYRSARALRGTFGSCAGIDILNGPGIQVDLESALAAGIPIERIHLFPFQAVLADPTNEIWFGQPTPPFSPPTRDPLVDVFRGAIELADRVLDQLNLQAVAPDRPILCPT